MQERDDTRGSFHLFQHLLHPRRLPVREDDFHAREPLHHGETDQHRGREHVVIEPTGQDRRHWMAELWEGGEECRARQTRAATRERSSAPGWQWSLAGTVLHLLEKRSMGGPFGIPQAGRWMHGRDQAELLKLGPERIEIRI